jgi:hypothetical protein
MLVLTDQGTFIKEMFSLRDPLILGDEIILQILIFDEEVETLVSPIDRVLMRIVSDHAPYDITYLRV